MATKIEINDDVDAKLNKLARESGMNKSMILDLLLNPNTEQELKGKAPSDIDNALSQLTQLSTATNKGDDIMSKMLNLETINLFKKDKSGDDMGMSEMMKMFPKMHMMKSFMEMMNPKKEEKSDFITDMEKFERMNMIFGGGKNKDEIHDSIEELKIERGNDLEKIDSKYGDQFNLLLDRLNSTEEERKRAEEEKIKSEKERELKQRLDGIEVGFREAIEKIQAGSSVNQNPSLVSELTKFKEVLSNVKALNEEISPEKESPQSELTGKDGKLNIGKTLEKGFDAINNQIELNKEIEIRKAQQAENSKPENIFSDDPGNEDSNKVPDIEPEFVEQPPAEDVLPPETTEETNDPGKQYIKEIEEL